MATTLHLQILKARGIPPGILKGPGSFYCLMQCGDVVEATEDEPGPTPEWFGEDVSSFEVELDDDRAELLVITLLDDGGTEGEDDDEEVAEVEISLVAMPAGVQTKKWFRMSGLTDPPAREIEVLLSIFLEVEGGEPAPGPITSLSFLEAGAGGERGITPLMAAAISGMAAWVRAALAAGGDPLERLPGTGLTAVHFAARSGSEESVRALLQASPGVAALAAEPSGSTPLHLAARKGHAGVARLLVAAGASALAADSKGSTPMHEAAAEGQTEVVLALSEGGAGGACSATDSAGTSVLELAAHGGHEGCARAVLCTVLGCQVGQTQLQRALEVARAGQQHEMAALLEQSA